MISFNVFDKERKKDKKKIYTTPVKIFLPLYPHFSNRILKQVKLRARILPDMNTRNILAKIYFHVAMRFLYKSVSCFVIYFFMEMFLHPAMVTVVRLLFVEKEKRK